MINVGSSADQVFTVTNRGGADLVLGSLTITGTDAFEFTIQSDNCSGQTFIPMADCSVNVLFSTTSGDEKRADLEITSNDPKNSIILVPLTGIGVDLCEGEFEPDCDVDGKDLAEFLNRFQASLAGLLDKDVK